MRRALLIIAALVLAGVAGALVVSHDARPVEYRGSLSGIHKIRQVVVIMQENRSFDSYFGTYPGADGIPRRGGLPTVCLPNPRTRRCVRPYHDTANRNIGGPHEHLDAIRDINGGRMNGFVARELLTYRARCSPDDSECTLRVRRPDL